MLPMDDLLAAMLAGLEFYLNTGRPPIDPLPDDRGADETKRPCKAVPRNTVAKPPPYPYLAYTPTSLKADGRGTYHQDPQTGALYRPVQQTISLTLQSDKRGEAQALAMAAHDFFEVVGTVWLADHDVVATKTGAITNRDNLITVQFEYRQGFDIVLTLTNRIETTKNEISGWINNVEWPPAEKKGG